MRPPSGEPGRVAVLDLLRARTRRFDTVFVLGLEEGSLPRTRHGSPFLDDDRRRELGARLERPDPVSRDRYLFYTACTRATRRLYLVRQAATDDGSPARGEPVLAGRRGGLRRRRRRARDRRRALSELTWPIEAAPTERERLRALARLSAATPTARSRARRRERLEPPARRARSALRRETRLTSAELLAVLGAQPTFGATELERFVDCSSAWLFERVVDPKTIDAEPTRCCAARSPTRRCTPSTPACRRSSGPSA